MWFQCWWITAFSCTGREYAVTLPRHNEPVSSTDEIPDVSVAAGLAHAQDGAAEFHLRGSSEASSLSSLSSCRDLLFEQLYSRLAENTVARGVFLESLESYIVADRLGHLTTPIMRDLLTHYQSSGMMEGLERCIVHLDITSLDIQQVRLSACLSACVWVRVRRV